MLGEVGDAIEILTPEVRAIRPENLRKCLCLDKKMFVFRCLPPTYAVDDSYRCYCNTTVARVRGESYPIMYYWRVADTQTKMSVDRV